MLLPVIGSYLEYSKTSSTIGSNSTDLLFAVAMVAVERLAL